MMEIEWGGGYTSVCICQNSLSVIQLKWVQFVLCKLFVNQVEF